jgi:PAS domain S-box-containing protein
MQGNSVIALVPEYLKYSKFLAFMVLDFEGRCIYMNDTFAKKYDFFKDYLLGDFFIKNLHEQDVQKYYLAIKECNQFDGAVPLNVCKYNEQDGSYYYIKGEIATLKNEATSLGLIYIIHEISQELDASTHHKNLHNINQLLNAILESPKGIIIFSLDNNYNYLYFTTMHKETMKSIWGVDIEVGTNMLECIHDHKDKIKAKKNFDRTLNGEYFVEKEEYGDENLLRTYWEDRYSPIFNQNNEIIGLTVFVTDITEQKRVEQVIKESEQKLDLLANNFPYGSISLIDTNLNFLYTGGAGYKDYGLNPKEFIGKSIKDIFEANLYIKIKDSLAYIRQGNSFSFEVNYGNRIYQNILQPVYNSKNIVDSFVLVATDITEIKNNELKIMSQNEKLRKIAWQQSHEVRKPVANILGLITLIEIDKEKMYDETYLQYLRYATEELDEIIHSIVRATDQE